MKRTMKQKLFFAAMMMAGALALSAPASEVDQLKADLVGQSMGGREKCWKFQSIDQIKQLVIKNKVENAQKLVYTVSMQLQASNTSARYTAEARIECSKTADGWKISQVGLLSLSKME
jgi:hypothetical protein